MAVSGLDEALNIGIPALLIIIVLGFVWTKFLEPFCWPVVLKMWAAMKAKNEGEDGRVTTGREIVYE